MIAEVVKVCKVEEMLVAKQFRVASKSNKIREWLKLLSMHQEN